MGAGGLATVTDPSVVTAGKKNSSAEPDSVPASELRLARGTKKLRIMLQDTSVLNE